MLIKNNDFLVSSPWLAEHLSHPQIVIIDCRFRLNDPAWGKQQYQENHIPGAYYFDLDQDLSSPRGQHGGRHPLPEVDNLAAKLADCGITRDTLVVCYDDSRFAFAARLWWLLGYLGHPYRALLDGGWQAWVAQGYPVTNTIPAGRAGQFLPVAQPQLIVNREELLSLSDSEEVVLLDAREGDRYRGEREPIDPIAGHIPGAVNLPWLEASTPEGNSLSLAELQTIWSEYLKSQSLILYCGSGVTACVNLWVLARLGFSNAQLYPGGWSDWCSYL